LLAEAIYTGLTRHWWVELDKIKTETNLITGAVAWRESGLSGRV